MNFGDAREDKTYIFESPTLLLRLFPYCCHKRAVHFYDGFQRAITYRETVQTMRGQNFNGVVNRNPVLNRTVTRERDRHLALPTDEGGCYLVFTSSPTEVFVTTQGRREIGDSGYSAEGVTLYEARDFLRYLQREL